MAADSIVLEKFSLFSAKGFQYYHGSYKTIRCFNMEELYSTEKKTGKLGVP